MTYQLHVAALYSKYVTGRAPGGFEKLFAALGCRHIARNAMGEDVVISPRQPDQADESFAQKILVNLLHTRLHQHQHQPGKPGTADDLALMDGLFRNDRWRSCLQSPEAAFDLGLLILYYWEVDTNTDAGHDMLEVVGPAITEVINTWLADSPRVKNSDRGTSSLDIAVALFGEPWCTIALGEVWSPSEIPLIIRDQRPPVRESLLPQHLHQIVTMLPTLEGP